MEASGIRASAAEVAAPIQKLCVLKCFVLRLSLDNNELMKVANVCRVNPLPSSVVKSGLWWSLRAAKYGNIPASGQMDLPVAPN